VTRYDHVQPLAPEHDTSGFDCGSDAQTTWLRRYALQAQRSGTSRVYVATLAGQPRVVGYHALAAGSVSAEQASSRVGAGVGRHPVPVVVLTRLGVDVAEQDRGLGRLLVRDALLRVAAAADTIGLRALLVHAESDAARSFYLHLAEFEPSPTDPLHLFLLIKDLRAAIR
jgi:ribosomal protein S18 acetylase RimI-like enzyme